jgi:hypothetical protein
MLRVSLTNFQNSVVKTGKFYSTKSQNSSVEDWKIEDLFQRLDHLLTLNSGKVVKSETGVNRMNLGK